MMLTENKCPVCGSNAVLEQKSLFFECDCPICGQYVYKKVDLNNLDLNHLSSYFAYNGFKNSGKFFTVMSQDMHDLYKNSFTQGFIKYGNPIWLEPKEIENWYPKTFSEKIDSILLYLQSKGQHIGETIYLDKEECDSILFVDRFDYRNGICSKRDSEKIFSQFLYMRRYLESSEYINVVPDFRNDSGNIRFDLTPKAYNRIDDLQKNNTIGNQVLVAMKFGDDTKPLREAIRQGVSAAGYKAIFIDEVQHNDFITPELLKYIKDSKFVVVDLTHKNNGAYFEEGYAMGLGKPVIQLCKEGVPLHFDIAQKNTIIWKTEDEIAERLKNRINATID